VLVLGGSLVGRRWPFAVAGVMIATAAGGLALTSGTLILVWASVIGFAAALALVVTLALPPLLVPRTDVPRFSAGIFLIMYASSFAGPLVGGAAWDATGWPPAAFVALAAGGVGMVALAAGTDLRCRA
jgi:CP family cyanate transporter-like MFS transporter